MGSNSKYIYEELLQVNNYNKNKQPNLTMRKGLEDTSPKKI